MFFILAPALVLVFVLVCYFVMALVDVSLSIYLVDLLEQNAHLEQIVVRIETIDLCNALAALNYTLLYSQFFVISFL